MPFGLLCKKPRMSNRKVDTYTWMRWILLCIHIPLVSGAGTELETLTFIFLTIGLLSTLSLTCSILYKCLQGVRTCLESIMTSCASEPCSITESWRTCVESIIKVDCAGAIPCSLLPLILVSKGPWPSFVPPYYLVCAVTLCRIFHIMFFAVP